MNLDGQSAKRILVAGIGNLFLGDDAFGCEVVGQLLRRKLPEEVRGVDFGIRGYDLAYALTEGYEAVILVDATPQGGLPGTLYLIEPELEPAEPSRLDTAADWPDAHSLDAVKVLQLARTFGGQPRRLYLVGCEPGTVDFEDGRLGLSAPVQAAVPKALEMIESLVRELLASETKTEAGLAPV